MSLISNGLEPTIEDMSRRISTLAFQNIMKFFPFIAIFITAFGLSIGCGSKTTPDELPKITVVKAEPLSVTFFVDGMV